MLFFEWSGHTNGRVVERNGLAISSTICRMSEMVVVAAAWRVSRAWHLDERWERWWFAAS
eukprot:12900790-Prorocentrum_lima.AAC.1